MSHPVSSTAANARSSRLNSSKTTQPICHKTQVWRLAGKSAVKILVRLLIGKSQHYNLAFNDNALLNVSGAA